MIRIGLIQQQNEADINKNIKRLEFNIRDCAARVA